MTQIFPNGSAPKVSRELVGMLPWCRRLPPASQPSPKTPRSRDGTTHTSQDVRSARARRARRARTAREPKSSVCSRRGSSSIERNFHYSKPKTLALAFQQLTQLNHARSHPCLHCPQRCANATGDLRLAESVKIREQ